MKRARLVIAFVVLVLLAIFTIQNWETVDIRFLLWHLAMPRTLLILLLVLSGFTLGLAFRVRLPGS